MELKGSVENIIYRNEMNGYTVLQVRTGKTVFTLVGKTTNINVGESIEADVTEVEHPEYGLQYNINNYKLIMPDDDEVAIAKFLLSLSIKGVGEVIIERLIKNFGKDLIEIIKSNPEKLYGIKGMTDTRINEMHDKVISRENEISVVIELEKYGLGNSTIKKIIDEYGAKALDVINENPYRLAMEVEGIGFTICDKIAKIKGFDVDDEKRIMAGVLF